MIKSTKILKLMRQLSQRNIIKELLKIQVFPHIHDF